MARSSFLSRLPRRAWYILIVTLALAPALVTLIDGRDVDGLNFIAIVDPDSIAAWTGRLATATILLAAATVVLLTPQRTVQSKTARRRLRWLAAALVVFALGHTILPSFLGAVPSFDPGALYAFAVLAAAYSARSLPSSVFFSAMKGSLLVLMVSGFVVAAAKPEMALQYVSADLRLPIIDFRYWGIGSSPNNIAPLALLLVMLTVHTPYKSILLNATAYATAGVTILLSQSQTTWAAALIVLPVFVFYCKTPKPIRKARVNPLFAVAAIVGVGAGLILLVWEASHVDLSSLFDASLRLESGGLVNRDENAPDSFTGRTVIWEAAMNTWRDHPWFGYGLTAWGVDFRRELGLPFASNAHNQFMQSVSIGGSIALFALIVYLSTLLVLSYRQARKVNGLSLAILGLTLIRVLTEGPLDTNTLLSGELLIHSTLIVITAMSVTRMTGKQQMKSTNKASKQSDVLLNWSEESRQSEQTFLKP
ncbi:MAG: O-antigen ligase family protein [Burkholderiaceae bacterium]